MKYSMIAVCSIALFAIACSSGGGGGKKLIVMSSGKLQTGDGGKTINFEPGNQHNELELNYSGSDKVTVSVKTGGTDKTYDLPEDGTYLLNLKSDTMIGSIVNFGSGGMPTSITTEQLHHIIDSTQQLIMGQNASDANKTYFLTPASIKKVSPNQGAKLIGPYNTIPAKVEADDKGNAPEIYKFFTNKQKREALNELIQRMNK